MPEVRLYQFTIYERVKEDFEKSSQIEKINHWNIVLKDSSELKERVALHAMADDFNKEEQCKGIVRKGMGEIPYYLVFRNPEGAGREYILSSGKDIINIDEIF